MTRSSNATSDFDVELNISGNYITHLLQLLVDFGKFPRTFDVGGTAAELQASSVVTRDYTAFDGTDYLHTDGDSLRTKFSQFDSRPKYVYFEITMPLSFADGSGAATILILRVKNDIDVQELFADIQAYVTERREHPDGPPFVFTVPKPRLSRYIKCIAGLATTAPGFDPDTTPDGSSEYLPSLINDQLKTALDTILDEMIALDDDTWQDSAINKLLEPLSPAAVSRLHLKALSDDVLGIYPVFRLLDKDGGVVEREGALGDANVLLLPGEDIGVCTKDDFFQRITEDIVLKMVLGLRLRAGSFTEADIPDKMNDISFPVTLGTTLIQGIMEGTLSLTDEETTDEEVDGEEADSGTETPQWLTDLVTFLLDNDIADLEIKGIHVNNEVGYTYHHQEGDDEVTDHVADSIRIGIEFGADLFTVFPLLVQNLNLYLTPVDHTHNDQACRDIGVSLNTSANAWVSLLSLLYPAAVAAPSVLPVPPLGIASVTAASTLLNFLALIVPAQYILTVVGNSLIRKGEDDKDKNTIGNLSELDVELFFNQVIEKVRWDPFYVTEHALVLPGATMVAEGTQLFFAAGVMLSNRTVAPYPTVYMRDITREGETVQRYDELFYKVEETGAIDTGSQFATNRFPSREVTDDSESHVYALEFTRDDGEDAVNRLSQGRLQPSIEYAPYAVQHGHDEDSDWIEKIQLLSARELYLLTERVKSSHFDEYIDSVVELFRQYYYDLNGEYPPAELTGTLRAAVTETYRASSDWEAYRTGGYESDLRTALYEPGVLRLLPWQEELQDLVIDRPFLAFPGHEYITPRDDRPYWRDKADSTTANNLESLPEVE